MKARKIKSIAITAIMALSSLTALPMSASAATDPNGDGVINIADSVYINSYLRGSYEVSDLSALDFNGDYVINLIDKVACQRYITGMDY